MSFGIFLLILSLFGIFGLLAFVTAITILFTSIGKNVSRMNTTQTPPPVTTAQFLANVTTAVGGSRCFIEIDEVDIITDNRRYKQQLLIDIENAQDSITIMTYMWDDDLETKEIFTTLSTAAQRGVDVRLLIDSFGSNISKEAIHELKNAGIHIQIFRPFKIGKLTLFFSRTHRRAYIFDGTIAYFGGVAMTRRWFKTTLANDFTYKDIMYRVHGEMVEHIASTFGEIWSTYARSVAENMYIPSGARASECNAFTLSHSPRNDVHPWTSTLWYSCAAAREEIVMITPYFIPGRAIADILCQQAKAGVSVKVITQGTAESKLVQYAARSYYDELLKAGVKIFEHIKPHMHAKILVIDNAFTVCGSANVDIRSQRINLEFVAGVQSTTFAERNKAILKDYEPHVEPVTKEDRQSVSYITKFIERSSHLISEQY